jgi:O-antigen ligase
MTAATATVARNDLRRSSLPRMADGLAAAVAASLPWSTSATGILIVLWLLASLPTLDVAALRREAMSAPGGLPVLLTLVAVAGLFWADVSWSERLHGLAPFLRLLTIPVLFAQFRRSERAIWVGAGFLVSATALLAVSLAMFAFSLDLGHSPGVPVKDDITQSGIFLLCGFAMLDIAVDGWAGRRRTAAAALGLLFLADIMYVSTSRTTLVVIPVLYALWGLRRLSPKRLAGFLLAGLALGAAVWIAAPAMRERLMLIPAEIATHQATGADTSSGTRLEFWKGSLAILRDAPLFGHGTGTIAETFRRYADPAGGASATNPHNQVFAIGIQLGAVGMAMLLAMWAAHWLLFLRPGLAAWIGLMAVTQNIVGSLFNSHLMDFTQGWLYVFAVGVFGGMAMRQRGTDAPAQAQAPLLAQSR